MAEKRRLMPCLKRHEPTGHAYARFDGRKLWFGPFESPQTHEQFLTALAEYLADESRLDVPEGVETMTVQRVLDVWLKYAGTVYVKDGRVTSELCCHHCAARAACERFGALPAREFGSRHLTAVGHYMADVKRWALTTIRQHTSRIRTAWKWLEGRGLVPAGSWQSLLTSERVRMNRPGVRLSEPVRPPDMDAVRAVQEAAPKPLRDLIEFQLLTGCRPTEACTLRPQSLRESGGGWVYTVEPQFAKTKGRLEYWLGPKARAIVEHYLPRKPERFIFVPLMARDNDRYTKDTYRRAVDRLCRSLKVARWHPHQLRHQHATDVRARFGPEGARVALNHSTLSMTEVYAERDGGLARRIAEEIG